MQILIQKEELPMIRELLDKEPFHDITIDNVTQSKLAEQIFVDFSNETPTDIYNMAKWVQLEKTKALLNQ